MLRGTREVTERLIDDLDGSEAIETAPVITVEQTIAGVGTVRAVWITGVGDPTVPPPSLMTWTPSTTTATTVIWAAI